MFSSCYITFKCGSSQCSPSKWSFAVQLPYWLSQIAFIRVFAISMLFLYGVAIHTWFWLYGFPVWLFAIWLNLKVFLPYYFQAWVFPVCLSYVLPYSVLLYVFPIWLCYLCIFHVLLSYTHQSSLVWVCYISFLYGSFRENSPVQFFPIWRLYTS